MLNLCYNIISCLKACVPKLCVLLYSAVLSCVQLVWCVIVASCGCQLDFNKGLLSSINVTRPHTRQPWNATQLMKRRSQSPSILVFCFTVLIYFVNIFSVNWLAIFNRVFPFFSHPFDIILYFCSLILWLYFVMSINKCGCGCGTWRKRSARNATAKT